MYAFGAVSPPRDLRAAFFFGAGEYGAGFSPRAASQSKGTLAEWLVGHLGVLGKS